MTAVLYAATAMVLLWLADRYVLPVSRGAAIALLLLPLVFTGRAVLTGRVYAPVEMPYMTRPLYDYRAALHVPPTHNPTLADIAFQMIPWREAVRRSLAEGEWPLWNRFMFCGDVLAAGMQPAVYSPFTWIACLLPAALSFSYTGTIAFFVAALSAWLFARELGASMGAALIAAIGWMFSGPIALLILWPVGFAWTLLPMVLLATRRLAHDPSIRSTGLLVVAFVLEIVAGHPETLLHVTAIALAYGLFELSVEAGAPARPAAEGGRHHTYRAVMLAIVAGVVALLITAVALLPFLDIAHESYDHLVRTAMYAKIPLKIAPGSVRTQLLRNLFPFLRPASEDLPLGRADAGSILLALAIAAPFAIRRREIKFLVALAIVEFLVGINAWPLAQFLHALPLFSSTLNDRLAVAVPLALAVLAALAVDAWPRRVLVIAMAAVIEAIVIAGIVAGTAPARLSAELVPLAIAAIVVVTVRKQIAVPLMMALILLQRTIADGSLIPVHPRSIAYPRLGLFQPMNAIAEPFRVAPTGYALLENTATMYGLEDVRGSTPMTLALLNDTFPMWLERRGRDFPQVNDLTRPFLSMINVRYALIELPAPLPPGWREVSSDISMRLIENTRVLPRAFIPRNVTFHSSPKQELEEMAQATDFAERAWLYVPGKPEDRTNGPGTVRVVRNKSGLDITVTMQRAGFVIVSEAAWSGWRAYVDEKRVRTLRANHAFLGVYVPAGTHRVRLRYLPQSFVVVRAISIATLSLIAVFLIARRRFTDACRPSSSR